MAEIFISYARLDGEKLAERLELDLGKNGHKPWRDRSKIRIGADWSRTIESAIDRCDTAIALLTTGAYDSVVCRAEQGRALRKQKRLLPLLVQKNADRMLYLEFANYIDFTDAAVYEASFAKLLQGIKDGTGILEGDLPSSVQVHLDDEIPVRSLGILLQLKEASWNDVGAFGEMRRARFLEALSPRKGTTGIFDPGLYITRADTERELDAFMSRDAQALLLVGASGVGKTNLLCSWSGKQTAAGHVALVYNCDRFATADVERELTRDLGIEDAAGLTGALDFLEQLAAKSGRRLLIVFDGINEFSDRGEGNDQQQLLASIDALVARLPGTNLRVILSCSTAGWRRLERLGAKLTWGRYHRTRDEEEPFVLLRNFDHDEIGAAFDAYRRHFGLKIEAAELPAGLHAQLRDPLVLRLLAETLASGRIGARALDTHVFALYVKERVRRHEDQFFVTKLAEEMWNQKSAALQKQSLAGHADLGPAVRSDDADSSYNRLLDAGVLLEVPGDLFVDDLVRFTYPLVGAYILARWQATKPAPLGAKLAELAKQASAFPLAWDAAVMLLANENRLEVYAEFAGASEPDLRELACASLVRLHDRDRERARQVLLGLLDSGSPMQQRTALRASFTIGPGTRDLILRAAMSKSETLQQAVKDTLFLIWNGVPAQSTESNAGTIYFLWRHSQDFTHEMIRDLVRQVSYANPRQLFRISRFVLSWIITLYTNHCERPEVARQVADLFHALMVGQLHLDKLPNMPRLILRNMPRLILRIFVSAGARPVVEAALMEDQSKFFARPAAERAVLATAAKLVDPAADVLASEELLRRMLASDVSVQRLTGTLVLAIHSYSDFARMEALHRRTFDSLDAAGRLWQLAGFSVLLPAAPTEWIPLLEDMTRRIHAEHPEVVNGHAGPPNGIDILLLPLGLAYGKRDGRMPLIEELLAAELKKGQPDRLVRMVTRLGPVGFYNPKGVLGALRPHLATLAETPDTRDALLVTLATLRTVHLDLVDEYVVDTGLDEAFHRQLMARTDTDLVSGFLLTLGLYNNAVHQCLFYPRMRRGLTVFLLERFGLAASAREAMTDYVAEGMRMAREANFQLLEWTRPD